MQGRAISPHAYRKRLRVAPEAVRRHRPGVLPAVLARDEDGRPCDDEKCNRTTALRANEELQKEVFSGKIMNIEFGALEIIGPIVGLAAIYILRFRQRPFGRPAAVELFRYDGWSLRSKQPRLRPRSRHRKFWP